MVLSMEITQMILDKVKNLLINMDIQFIESPYESDHQLTFMQQSGQIDAIITEDTDFVAHKNNNILYKLESNGDCFSLSYDDINKIKEFENFEYEDFLIFCILCVSFESKYLGMRLF